MIINSIQMCSSVFIASLMNEAEAKKNVPEENKPQNYFPTCMYFDNFKQHQLMPKTYISIN